MARTASASSGQGSPVDKGSEGEEAEADSSTKQKKSKKGKAEEAEVISAAPQFALSSSILVLAWTSRCASMPARLRMMRSASAVSPYLFIWALPGSVLLLPFLAWHLDARRKERLRQASKPLG